jgi:hypothetical protein
LVAINACLGYQAIRSGLGHHQLLTSVPFQIASLTIDDGQLAQNGRVLRSSAHARF